MTSRWKHDRPMSRAAFNKRFPTTRPALDFSSKTLAERLRLPSLQRPEGVELATKRFTYECAACGRQTSVTAGTVFIAATSTC